MQAFIFPLNEKGKLINKSCRQSAQPPSLGKPSQTDLFLACALQIVLALWGRVIYPISLHPLSFLWYVCIISTSAFDSKHTCLIREGGCRLFGQGGRRCVDWETLTALAFPIWPLIGVDWGKCQGTFLCLRPCIGYYESWHLFKVEGLWTRHICVALDLNVLRKLLGSSCEFNKPHA